MDNNNWVTVVLTILTLVLGILKITLEILKLSIELLDKMKGPPQPPAPPQHQRKE